MAAAQVTRNELEEILGLVVAGVYREVGGHIAALESKLARLEGAMAEFKYCGPWQERAYKRGNFVTHGSVWHCNVDTSAKPGTNGDWSVALAMAEMPSIRWSPSGEL
jgi:hypothetical protein